MFNDDYRPRFMNMYGMLPYEDEVAKAVEENGIHVLYRVTPYFIGENLVCNGVLIEAKSFRNLQMTMMRY